jgi:chromosome partitioning protein
MRTIAIVNQKGGCGKTTTAINLSAVLARRGRRTLLVDMDPQSHCAAGLGVPEQRIERGIAELLLADLERPVDGGDLLWEIARGLHLAPSTVSLAGLEAAGGGLASRPDRDRRLSKLLAWLAPRFDLCIVDCPPTIGLLTFNALRAADEAIVPVETGYFALRGAERQIAIVARTIERLGRDLPCWLLPTLHDEHRAVDRDVLDSLRRVHRERVMPVVIREHDVLREAASLGQAVTEYAPGSEADLDFEALAEWLLAHPPAQREAIERPTFVPAALAPELPRDQLPRGSRAAELARRMGDRPLRPSGAELSMLRREAAPEAVPIVVAAAGIREVRVFGDFNGWQRPGLELELRPDGTAFEGSLPLAAGRVRYRLVIDGRESLDPANARRDVAPDGREANVIERSAPEVEALRRDAALPPALRVPGGG